LLRKQAKVMTVKNKKRSLLVVEGRSGNSLSELVAKKGRGKETT